MTEDAVSVGPTRGLYLILKDLLFSLYKKYSFLHFFHSGSLLCARLWPGARDRLSSKMGCLCFRGAVILVGELSRKQMHKQGNSGT